MSSGWENLMQKGMAALRADQAERAEQCFLQAAKAAGDQAPVHLALAFARVRREDADGALAAVDRALELAPRDLRALLFKADHLERMGRGRTAVEFYLAALRVAEGQQSLPQDIARGLQRARTISDRYAGDYADYLLQALDQRGFRPDRQPRFAESLDIALGRKPVQYQQPTRYYFPGLPQRAFYEREEFAWAGDVEAETGAIREELLALLAGNESAFQPYLEAGSERPHLNDRSNLGSMDWSAFYLWRDGAPVPENLQRCPATARALEAAPLPKVAGQTPSALFSRLAPGATIPPHHGVLNTRLICHLPVIVPPDCGSLRVGNTQRSWREGELLIFDDSMEHEAWNHSSRERVVLLFDIWRPELSPEERHWVSELLLAVDAYEGR